MKSWLRRLFREHPTLMTLIIVSVLASAATVTLLYTTVPDPSVRNRCLGNIEDLQEGIRMCLGARHGKWSASLKELHAVPGNTPFLCPLSGTPKNPETTPDDYFYLAPANNWNTLILCELSDLHPYFGRAVGFADGKCEMLTNSQLETELAKPMNARFAAAYREALKKYEEKQEKISHQRDAPPP